MRGHCIHLVTRVCVIAIPIAILTMLAVRGAGQFQRLYSAIGDFFQETERDHNNRKGWQQFRKRREDRVAVRKALVKGRLSLRDAVTRYNELDKRSPAFAVHHYRHRYPGNSDSECQCRRLIDHVRISLESDPDHQEFVVQRLEAELNDLLAQELLP